MQIIDTKYIVIALCAIFLASCASGTAIVTGTKRAPLKPIQVKLYLEAPSKYEVIGIVKASSDAGWTEQGSVDYAIKEIKSQAAKLGANGVLLQSTGESTSTVISSNGVGGFYAIPVISQTVSGKAIYVSE